MCKSFISFLIDEIVYFVYLRTISWKKIKLNDLEDRDPCVDSIFVEDFSKLCEFNSDEEHVDFSDEQFTRSLVFYNQITFIQRFFA